MKFRCLSQTGNIADKDIMKEEFKAAIRAGEGRMGAYHLFYRYFINVSYIPYEKIKAAYLRVESGESGEVLLKEFYLVVCFNDNAEKKLRFEREENARVVLTYLEENYPQIEIGYKKGRAQ